MMLCDLRRLDARKLEKYKKVNKMSDERILQQKIDVDKWLDSENRHFDMCGNYDYCACCDKQSDTPCADAYMRMTENASRTVESTTRTIDVLSQVVDMEEVTRKRAARKSLSFVEKYSIQSDVVKERYATLKNALTTTKKGAPPIKSRISRHCDTYRKNGVIVAKITIIGTSLRINLPLDPDAPEFNDGKTPHTATGHKKAYECVPFQFKVNSRLAVKRALKLIELVK